MAAIHFVAAPSCQHAATHRNHKVWLVKSLNGKPKCCRVSHRDDKSLYSTNMKTRIRIDNHEMKLRFVSLRWDDDIRLNWMIQSSHFKCIYSKAAAICLATRFEWSSPIPLSETFDVKSPENSNTQTEKGKWEWKSLLLNERWKKWENFGKFRLEDVFL